MTKTLKMLLIEERAGRDIREVLATAFNATGSIQQAAAQISALYGEPVSNGRFSEWAEQLGGKFDKQLRFPDPATVNENSAEPLAA